MSKRKRIGLVGSVNAQPSSPSPAIDLYRSAGFLEARRRVESACETWFILSPEYHLVEPGDWLEPYELTMASLSVSERTSWSAQVLAQLEEKLGELKGLTFELHAGPEFTEHGLVEGLLAAKAKVSIGGAEPIKAAVPKSAPAKPRKPAPEMPVATRRRLLDEFYGLLAEQAEVIGGYWSLPDCTGDDHWPLHGVVFYFEPGELREDGQTPRVVRVGSHALTATSKTRLWDRLRADRGAIGGANPGSGNHRASALRRHVGRALIARDGYPEAAESWGSAGRVSAEEKQRELDLEIAVSKYVAQMDFIWMAVPEAEDRVAIDKGTVSLLSNAGRQPVDPASENWLGHSAGESISRAGIWNVDYTEWAPDAGVLELLRRHIDA